MAISNDTTSKSNSDDIVLKNGWVNDLDFNEIKIDYSLVNEEFDKASPQNNPEISSLPPNTYHVYSSYRSLHAENLVMQFTSSRFGLPPGLYTYDAYKFVAAVQIPSGYEGKPYQETSCLPCGYNAFTSNPSTTKLGIVYEATSSNVLIMTTLAIHIKEQNGIWPIDVWTPFDAFDYDFDEVRFTYKIRPDDGWKH